jgi:hypothetical protein
MSNALAIVTAYAEDVPNEALPGAQVDAITRSNGCATAA